jgi:hypothetical protein
MLVVGDVVVLVGEQLGGEDPDLLGVVSRVFHIHLVDELHEGDALSDLLGPLQDLHHLLPGLFVEFPNEAVVVAVGEAELFELAQRRQGLATSQQMIKLQPQVPGEAVVRPLGLDASVELGREGVETLIPGRPFGVAEVQG